MTELSTNESNCCVPPSSPCPPSCSSFTTSSPCPSSSSCTTYSPCPSSSSCTTSSPCPASSKSSSLIHRVYPFMKPCMTRCAFKWPPLKGYIHTCSLHFRHGHFISLRLLSCMSATA